MMPQEQKNGDWRGLWKEFGPKLLLFARQQTPALSDAEDIVQEAFVRYWKARQSDPALSPNLLYTLVKRIAIDQARRIACRQSHEAEALALCEAETASFANPMEDQERKEYVEALLNRLPETQREVLVLKIWGELTFEEIGQALDLSPNTAASRYRYAVQQLREQLTPLCHE